MHPRKARPAFSFLFLLLSLWPVLVFPADYYWVGGSGNWSDINHWATTSGGNVNHFTVPSPNDNVYFDQHSFGQAGGIVNLNLNLVTCHDFDASQVLHSPLFISNPATTIEVYGSFFLNSGADYQLNSDFFFRAEQSGNLIQTAGHSFRRNVFFSGTGGEWTLQSELSVPAYALHLVEGSLNAAGYPVSAAQFNSNYTFTRSLDISQATIAILSSFSINNSGLSFNATGSVIFMNGLIASLVSSGSGSPHFHKVFFTAEDGNVNLNTNNASFDRVHFSGSAKIYGNNTYGDLVMSAGEEYIFQPQSTQLFLDSLIAEGHCLSPIEIRASSAFATFSKSAGNLRIAYVQLKNIHTGGSAVFEAIDCEDLGNNTGWTFLPSPSRTLYWVKGTGVWTDTTNWSLSSGGPGGECPPRMVDDVVFDNQSFPNMTDSVLVNEDIAYCHNMTWQAGLCHPSLIGAGGSFLHIYGSLQFQETMALELSGPLLFRATDTGNTIKMAGQLLTMVAYFDGDGGSWTLLDSFEVEEHNIDFMRGHLITAGNKVRCYRFISPYSHTRELSLGQSKVIIESGNADAAELQGQNLSLNAGTSEIIFTAADAGFVIGSGNNLLFHNVTFASNQGNARLNKTFGTFNRVRFFSNARIIGSDSIDTLWLAAGKAYRFQKFSSHNLSELIAEANCREPILLFTDSTGGPTYFHGGPGIVEGWHLILQDIYASTGNFIAYETVDLGNNHGWQIYERDSADYYWINGQGYWHDTLHWSLSSGGAPGGCIPSPVDNVIFDQQSFNTLTDSVLVIQERIMCRDMRWITTLHQAVFSGPVSSQARIYGSLLLSPLMDYQFKGPLYFLADTLGKTLTLAGNKLLNNLSFDHREGGWTLTDTLWQDCISCRLNLVSGSLDMQERFARISGFTSDEKMQKLLDIRQAEIQVAYGNWHIDADSGFVLGDSSHILMMSAQASFWHHSPDTTAYGTLIFDDPTGNTILDASDAPCSFLKADFAGSASIRGNHIYDSLFLAPGGAYTFDALHTQRFHHLRARGNCFSPIFLFSDLPNNGSVFFSDQDSILIDFCLLKGIQAQGSAVFQAENTEDLGFNQNWLIDGITPNELYWVNGTGNWHDSAHWAYSSGGASGACIPTSRDNVFFDSHSFTGSSEMVNIQKAAECKDMHWLGSLNAAEIKGNYELSIYGSLYLHTDMRNTLLANWNFRSDSTGNIIHTAGHPFLRSIYFDGSGGWLLTDSLEAYHSVNLVQGNLNTSGHKLKCSNFNSDGAMPRSLLLGSSLVEILGGVQFSWVINRINLTLDAGTSLIRFPYTTGMYSLGSGNLQYHNVEFLSPNGQSTLRSSQVHSSYNHVRFLNNGRLLGNNTFDSLTFTPDHTYRLDTDYPQSIVDHLWVRGNNCFPVRLESTQEGVQADLNKASGTVAGDFIHIRDINAGGGAVFYAGANSTDIGNNSGWIFNNAPSYVYGFPSDTFLLKGTPLVLQTTNFNGGPNTSYLWDDGSTGLTLTVTDPGMYYITVTYDNNCTVYDSIRVSCRLGLDFTPIEPTCNAYADGALQLSVQGDPAPYQYLWSTGDTTPGISGIPSAWYSVSVTDSVCTGVDSIFLGEPPLPEAHLQDTAFCEDTLIQITAKPGFAHYLWYDGTTGPVLSLNREDSIWLVVTDSNGCVSVPFEAFVRADPLPEPLLTSGDSCLQFDRELWLYPGEFDAYLWQDGSTGQEFRVDEAGSYAVQVKLATCYAGDTLYVDVCPPELRLPNVFTPNGDGYNDAFRPESVNIVRFHLRIVNRWGMVLFETYAPDEGWNGRYQGGECAEGTYFYEAEYAMFPDESRTYRETGVVTLLR
jgi:gliding motility-associated-like protein